MADVFTMFRGQTSPDLREIVTLNGEPVDLTVGSPTVKLQGYLSGHDPSPLKIDAAAGIDDAANGVVRYAWAAGDTDTAGVLVLWWLVTQGGEPQSTPAFVVPVLDQATLDPGSATTYASVLDVKALAGVLSRAWTPTSTPSESDLRVYLELAAGDIDVALSLAGAALPLVDPLTIAALRSLSADGALVRAIDATWPRDQTGQIMALRADALARWTLGIKALEDGTSPIVDLIASDSGDQASSLWTSEPEYGYCGWWNGTFYLPADPADRNPNLAPTNTRAETF